MRPIKREVYRLVILKKKVPGLSAESLDRFVLRARKAVRLNGTVNVLLTSSNTIRTLNLQFRGKDRPTDVLSFPAGKSSSVVRGRVPFAGEIVISADIAVDSARQFGHSAATEVKVLVLHGILHLAGFDHERDNGQMARKEASLRQALRLPLSLTERNERGFDGSGKSYYGEARSRRSQKTA